MFSRDQTAKAFRPASAALLLFLSARCSSTPAPVAVAGNPADLSALAGRWEGEYESKATGRMGSISFELTAGEDRARGDVLMIPRGSKAPYRPVPRPGGEAASPAAASQLLTITFVKAEGSQVTGTLEPYWDPDCNCEVTTTFAGEVHGDRVEGTFTSSRTAGRVFGTWKATRKR